MHTLCVWGSRLYTETDKAYLAGFVDGEGHITIGSRGGGKGYYLGSGVTNTHEGVLLHLQRIWGGNLTTPRARGTEHQKAGELKWSTSVAVKMLREIQPYMIVKAEQCRLALEFAALLNPPEHSTRPISQENWEQREAIRLALRERNARRGKVQPRKYEEKPTLTCQFCGTEFTTYQKTRKYCSPQCNQKAHRQAYYDRHQQDKTCPDCGKQFTTWRKDQVYCSPQCGPHGRHHQLEAVGTRHTPYIPRAKQPRVCLVCIEMYTPRLPTQKFCSEACRRASLRERLRLSRS